MSYLWWLQEGWDQATCSSCGVRIWPEGDPDWGMCYECFTAELEQQEHYRAMQAEEDAARMKAEQDAFDAAQSEAR